MAEIKSCPFCGGEGMPIPKWGILYGKYYEVKCSDCRASISTFRGRKAAIEMWNTRIGEIFEEKNEKQS